MFLTTRTDMRLLQASLTPQMHSTTAHDLLRQLSPLMRLGETSEVVELVLYLESAHFINGEVVHLDGGAHAGKW